MEDASIWLVNLKTVAVGLLTQILHYLPNLAGAVLLLVVGWLLARLMRTLAVQVAEWANRMLETIVPTGGLARFRLSLQIVRLIGDITFWLIMFVAVTIAADVAELETFSGWLKSAIGYLPHLLAGGMMIVAGYVIGVVVRDLVATALSSVGIVQSDLIGLAAQWATFLTALIIGIEQVGVDVTFLIVVIAIVVAALVGGIALAFGLGARPLATNLIGAHYLQQQYAPGQVLNVGGLEGRILEFTATGVLLDTSSGRSSVPGAVYFQDTITVKGGDETNA